MRARAIAVDGLPLTRRGEVCPGCSPDGRHFVTRREGPRRTWWWPLRSVARRFWGRSPEGPAPVVRALVWSRDGATVASSADDGRVRVLRGADRREVRGERDEAPRVAFSRDGQRLYVVTSAAIEVADVAGGAIVARFASFGKHIHSAEITGDGRYLVAGSYSHGTRVIDVETGAPVASERTETTRASRLVIADDSIIILKTERRGPIAPAESAYWVRLDLRGKVLGRGSWVFEEAGGAELCADGSTAMFAVHTRGGHRLLTVDLRTPELPGQVVAIPAGIKLVDTRAGRALFLEKDAAVCRDPDTGDELWRIHCPRPPRHASLSPRGDAVAVVYRDQAVEVFSRPP